MKFKLISCLVAVLFSAVAGFGQATVLDEANAVALSPDGKFVAGGGAKVIKIWEVETGKESKILLDLESITFNSIVFLPDGETLISGGDDVVWWNFKDGKKIRTYSASIVSSIALSPDAKTLVIAEKKYIKVLDASNGKEKAILVGHQGDILSVKFSSNGKYLISGSKDRSVKIWDFAECTKVGRSIENADDKEVKRVEISPDGTVAASGGSTNLRLWDIASGNQKFEYDEKYIYGLTFLPDGKTLISADISGEVKAWDTSKGYALKTLFEAGSSVSDIVVSKDGNLLFLALDDDKSIKVIETNSGKLVRTLK